jgi:hypothetical protein
MRSWAERAADAVSDSFVAVAAAGLPYVLAGVAFLSYKVASGGGFHLDDAAMIGQIAAAILAAWVAAFGPIGCAVLPTVHGVLRRRLERSGLWGSVAATSAVMSLVVAVLAVAIFGSGHRVFGLVLGFALLPSGITGAVYNRLAAKRIARDADKQPPREQGADDER